MKALTLHQPWATLIAQGHKRVENRTWRTGYRGPLAIHAGLKLDPAGFRLARWLGIELPAELPRSQILAVTELVDCRHIDRWFDLAAYPSALRDFAAGPWCWILADVAPLYEPVLCRGQRGLFDVRFPYELHRPQTTMPAPRKPVTIIESVPSGIGRAYYDAYERGGR